MDVSLTFTTILLIISLGLTSGLNPADIKLDPDVFPDGHLSDEDYQTISQIAQHSRLIYSDVMRNRDMYSLSDQCGQDIRQLFLSFGNSEALKS